MSDLVIVTDSTADLPKELTEEYNITVVPLKIVFGSDTYRDGVDISFDEFFSRLAQSASLPSTSQPSPGDFSEVYERLLGQGKEIISIHLSEQFSGTVRSAQVAQGIVGNEHITVIDSRMVSVALGLIVLEAAKAVKAGKTKEEVLALIESMIAKTRTYFLVDTLDYLEKGGRIGKAQTLIGTLLNIKPILTFREGQIYPHEKVRGLNKAIQKIIDDINEEFADRPLSCAFVYGTDFEVFTSFHDKVKGAINCSSSLVSRLGPVVGTHGGPGIVGVVCYPQ